MGIKLLAKLRESAARTGAKFRLVQYRKRLNRSDGSGSEIFMKAFQYSTCPMSISDMDTGRYIKVNDAFMQTLGYSYEEILQKGPAKLNLYHNPQDRQKVLDELKLNGHVRHMPIECNCANGDVRVGELSLDILYADGKRLLFAVMNDLTELHIVHQRLQESEERFRGTFEHVSVGIAHTSLNRQLLLVNDKFCEITGYSKEELIGLTFDAITHPDDIECSAIMLQKAMKNQSITFEKRYIRKNGTIIWVDVTSSLSSDASYGKPYMITVVQDITTRKAAQLSLIESEGKLRLSQAMAHVGNWELDLATKSIWASEECFNIYGLHYRFDHPYLPLSLVQACVKRADRPLMDNALKMLLDKNEKYDVEYTIIRASDGTERRLHSVAQCTMDSFGKPIKVIGAFQDVTERYLFERSLADSEATHRAMIANIADIITVIDDNCTIRYISPNVEKWLGWMPDELIGRNGWEGIHPDDCPVMQEKLAKLLQDPGSTNSAEYRHRCKDGSYKTLELTAVNMMRNPLIQGVLMNCHDISERTRAQVECRTIVHTAMDGFCVFDRDGQFIDVNEAYCQLSGYNRDELLTMTVTASGAIQSLYDPAQHIEKLRNVGTERFETKHRRRCGQAIDVEISTNLIPSRDGRDNYICAFFRDITERKQHEAKISYLSFHDKMTGLHNRSFFDEECSRLDSAKMLPVSVIMGDINGLKLTNDVFGHKEGDKMLAEIASILEKCAGSEGIVARTGGDEFCILLPNTDSGGAQSICSRIYKTCDEYNAMIGEGSVHPNISLGYASKTLAEQTIESIIKDAEDSMNRRKLLERKSMHSSLISAIRTTLLVKNHETKEHADRLATIAKAIGQSMNLSSDQLYKLELLAVLHDIGKIGIDDRILTSPKKLSVDEWVEMRKHPEIGYRIALASPELIPIADSILYHHERWDGTGYPQGLKAKQIPLLARILSVVDAYDAMVNDRPYRKALATDVAAQEILNNAGQQFDPVIVEKFLSVIGYYTPSNRSQGRGNMAVGSP